MRPRSTRGAAGLREGSRRERSAGVIFELAGERVAVGGHVVRDAESDLAALFIDDLDRGRADDYDRDRVVVSVPAGALIAAVGLHLDPRVAARAGVFAVQYLKLVGLARGLDRVEARLPGAVESAAGERRCRHQPQR